MTRTAETTQTFLQWHDDIPYLITWTPGPVVGTLSARVADDDFAQLAAEPWSTDIRMEVATAALAQIAAVNVAMHHQVAAAERAFVTLAEAA